MLAQVNMKLCTCLFYLFEELTVVVGLQNIQMNFQAIFVNAYLLKIPSEHIVSLYALLRSCAENPERK